MTTFAPGTHPLVARGTHHQCTYPSPIATPAAAPPDARRDVHVSDHQTPSHKQLRGARDAGHAGDDSPTAVYPAHFLLLNTEALPNDMRGRVDSLDHFCLLHTSNGTLRHAAERCSWGSNRLSTIASPVSKPQSVSRHRPEDLSRTGTRRRTTACRTTPMSCSLDLDATLHYSAASVAAVRGQTPTRNVTCSIERELGLRGSCHVCSKRWPCRTESLKNTASADRIRLLAYQRRKTVVFCSPVLDLSYSGETACSECSTASLDHTP